ncbi:MAG: energy transducer TonB [Selenomonas sp.]|nr:energy transducer TonB [Selenomonas sp.]
MRYQTHWRFAFLIAFFFHIVAWLFLMVLIPHVFKHIEQPPPDEPMEWVELAGDDGPPEEEQQPEEPPPPPPPEPAEAEEEPAVVEAEVPEEAISDIVKPPDDDEKKEDEKPLPPLPGQEMGKPSVIIHSERFPEGLLPIKGSATVSARIGKDGTVIRVKMQRGTGNPVWDFQICRLVQKRWKFKPATDQHGQPMESDRQCNVKY